MSRKAIIILILLVLFGCDQNQTWEEYHYANVPKDAVHNSIVVHGDKVVPRKPIEVKHLTVQEIQEGKCLRCHLEKE